MRGSLSWMWTWRQPQVDISTALRTPLVLSVWTWPSHLGLKADCEADLINFTVSNADVSQARQHLVERMKPGCYSSWSSLNYHTWLKCWGSAYFQSWSRTSVTLTSAYWFLDGLRITSQAPTCLVVEQQRQFAVPQERSRRLSQSSGLYFIYTINNSPVRNFLNAFPWWTERAVPIRGGLLSLLNKPWREEHEEKSARLQECKKHRLQIVCRTNVWSRASHSLPFESRERVKIMCGRCQKEQVWLRKRGRSTTTMAGAKGGGGKRKRKRWSDRRADRRWRGAMQSERGRRAEERTVWTLPE